MLLVDVRKGLQNCDTETEPGGNIWHGFVHEFFWCDDDKNLCEIVQPVVAHLQC